MAFVLEQNEPPHPVHIALLSAARIVFEADLIADTFDNLSARLVKEFFGRWRHGQFGCVLE